jgi:hypothetical protein
MSEGPIYTELTLKNEIDAAFAKRGYIKPDEIRQMTVQAIVDTGAWVLEGMDLTINPKRELVGVHGDIVTHRV